MSRKIIILIIVAAIAVAGTGAGLGTYFFMKNKAKDEKSDKGAAAEQPIKEGQEKNQDEKNLRDIENKLAVMNSQMKSIDEKMSKMDEGQKTSQTAQDSGDASSSQSDQDITTTQNDNVTESTVSGDNNSGNSSDGDSTESSEAQIISQSEEEAYIDELESELQDYYSIYGDAEALINETEALLEDLDAALTEAEQIYDEVDAETQAAIDAAMQYSDEFEQNLSQFAQVSSNFKAQYDSLEGLTELRANLLQIQKNGTKPEMILAIKDYFSQTTDTLGSLKGKDLNQFSIDYLSDYFVKIPDYLNLQPLTGVFDSLNGFEIPAIDLPSIDLPDIELPDLGK